VPRFVASYRVGWPDVDLARIVYFARFFSYFEHAELEWVRSLGFKYVEWLEHLGVWLPRVAAHCDYRAPGQLDDELSIEMRLERLGGTSFTFAYEVYRGPERERLADGYTVIATVSRENFRPVRVPETLRGMLERLADER
jgi:acyl-CoA thioester hydrolase